MKKRETVEEYLARGGKITVLPPGATSAPDAMMDEKLKAKYGYARRAGKAGQAALRRSKIGLGENTKAALEDSQ